MSEHNPNCFGQHCTRADGEVRRYPLAACEVRRDPFGTTDAFLLCRDCFEVENGYREEARLRERRPEDWPHVYWDTAEQCPEPGRP